MPNLPALCAILCLLCSMGCATLPANSPHASKRIPVGWGPEDLVLDDFGPEPRILVSCDDRREVPGRFSGIVSYFPASGRVDTLQRLEEPVSLNFHPLGMDIEQIEDKLYLFIISIDENQGQHAILQYQVEGNELYWIRSFTSPFFRSPNAVSIHQDRGFFVSNDRFNRNSFAEMALSKKKSQLVYCDMEGNARIVESKVGFGNGIVQKDGFLFQAALRGNQILRYRVAENGDLSDKEVWAKVKGPDNLRLHGDHLLVACHLRPFAFLRHSKHAEKRSPTVIYRISTQEKVGEFAQPQLVYADDGGKVSAGSGAIYFNGKVYISQVFDPFLRAVDLMLPR